MIETEQQRREREHHEDLQRLRGFRPIDDDFMRGLFRKNIPLAQLVLRIITGKKDLIITNCETQADMKRVTGARSICLDAYGIDDSGRQIRSGNPESGSWCRPAQSKIPFQCYGCGKP